MGKGTCAAGFLRNMSDGLDTDPVFPPLGGAENAVLFVDLAVKRIFNLDQQNPVGVNTSGYFDLPLARCGAKACLQRIFQQVGSTRHISISSTCSVSGKSSLARKGISSRFAMAQ